MRASKIDRHGMDRKCTCLRWPFDILMEHVSLRNSRKEHIAFHGDGNTYPTLVCNHRPGTCNPGSNPRMTAAHKIQSFQGDEFETILW
jgi:hypothetical protein